MVYGSAAEESRPRLWPIMREYRECLENALEIAGLKHVLTECKSERKKDLGDMEIELGLPQGELQKRMDEREERRRQGHGRRSEGEAAGTGHGAEKEDRVQLRHHLRPIRIKYRECLEKGLPVDSKDLAECRAKRRKALEDLGLDECQFEKLMEQRRAERSCQVESKSDL